MMKVMMIDDDDDDDDDDGDDNKDPFCRSLCVDEQGSVLSTYTSLNYIQT